MNNNSKGKALQRRNAFLATSLVVILLMIGVWLLVPSNYQLVIRDMKTKEILWADTIEKGNRFAHRYIHSVEKSPVKEVFQFSDMGEIRTMESWTKSFGAGLPYQRKGEVAMEDGYYVLKNINRPIHDDVLRMKPSNLYPHTFLFQNQTIYLSEQPFVGRVIEIDVIRSSLWKSFNLNKERDRDG
ncbi:DUF1850 domain-containing protein [Gracilibacillus thailandensis]|uniref:DUF1850 domain-containing protein n=1 Tax=Gracilibacillus thailandensis TaxID=563735 RepID=A0A6N7QWH6_9BACI|nr:DUF1850 domain-containing protein [Gracilibacillus thailandensis]MRI66467.1 DUF1850 domain-containing protein [Gracilibacillus thailandensis]